jgi:hypothetical protein
MHDCSDSIHMTDGYVHGPLFVPRPPALNDLIADVLVVRIAVLSPDRSARPAHASSENLHLGGGSRLLRDADPASEPSGRRHAALGLMIHSPGES